MASLLLRQRSVRLLQATYSRRCRRGAALTRSAMRRLTFATGFVVLAGLLAPASTYAQQSVSFYVGGLVTPDYYHREFADVLASNLSGGEYSFAFDIHEFAGI